MAASIILGGVLLVAAATDIRHGKVYNWLTYPAAIAGVAYHASSPVGLGLSSALAGAAAGGGLLFLFYVYGLVNGGDVKLITAVGAWCGFPLIGNCLVASCLAGALMSLVYMVVSGRLFAGLRAIGWSVASAVVPGLQPHLQPSGVTVPFAVAISLGTGAVLFLRHL
jgi:prepilin peptidase CpaA